MKRNVKQFELVGNSSYRSQRQLNVDEGKGNLVRKIEANSSYPSSSYQGVSYASLFDLRICSREALRIVCSLVRSHLEKKSITLSTWVRHIFEWTNLSICVTYSFAHSVTFCSTVSCSHLFPLTPYLNTCNRQFKNLDGSSHGSRVNKRWSHANFFGPFKSLSISVEIGSVAPHFWVWNEHHL